MLDFDPTDFVPFLIFSIPIIAVSGGIVAGIVRMMHRQQSWELLQRERIAAIERGVDLEKLAQMQPSFAYDERGPFANPRDAAQERRQNLMIGGIITLFVGVALAVFLNGVAHERNVWMVGLIPIAAGLGLLVSAMVIRRTDHQPPSQPPTR